MKPKKIVNNFQQLKNKDFLVIKEFIDFNNNHYVENSCSNSQLKNEIKQILYDLFICDVVDKKELKIYLDDTIKYLNNHKNIILKEYNDEVIRFKHFCLECESQICGKISLKDGVLECPFCKTLGRIETIIN